MSAASTVQTLDSVNSFLGEKHGLLIGGRWSPSASNETFGTENPSTEATLAQVARGGTEDIDRAVQTARQAFESGAWPRMNPSERGQLLWKLADLVEANAEEFAQLESLDNGKPLVGRPALRTWRSPSTTSATTPAGPPRSRARPSRSTRPTGRTLPRLHAARAGGRGRARSFPGTSPC